MKGGDLSGLLDSIRFSKTIKKYSSSCSPTCHQNVLIVDDDSMNLIALYGILVGFGIQPAVANSGQMAVKLFQEKYKATCCTNKFDIVLTDIQMPGMDGFRVAECIKATEMAWAHSVAQKSNFGKMKVAKNCPIIAITASYSSQIQARAKQIGFSHVL